MLHVHCVLVQSSRVDVSGTSTSTTRPRPQSDVFVSNGDVDVTCDMLPNSALRSHLLVVIHVVSASVCLFVCLSVRTIATIAYNIGQVTA